MTIIDIINEKFINFRITPLGLKQRIMPKAFCALLLIMLSFMCGYKEMLWDC